MAKREESEKPVKRFYPLTQREKQPYAKHNRNKENAPQVKDILYCIKYCFVTVLLQLFQAIGWVLGVRSKTTSINEDGTQAAVSSTSEPSKQSSMIGILPPTHPSVSLFQENGFEQRVREFI